jgi:hypothetical protein
MGDIEVEVKNLLRKNFEESKYRKVILNLDSLQFQHKVVLNPPPPAKTFINKCSLTYDRRKRKTN